MNIQKLRYFLAKDDYAAFSTALTEELKTLVDDVNVSVKTYEDRTKEETLLVSVYDTKGNPDQVLKSLQETLQDLIEKTTFIIPGDIRINGKVGNVRISSHWDWEEGEWVARTKKPKTNFELVKTYYPKLNINSIDLIASWYDAEEGRFDPEDFRDMLWASNYDTNEVINLQLDLYECGYFELDEMPHFFDED